MEEIQAKDYVVSHYEQYPFEMKSKEDMIALLNILQVNDETLDTMHDAVFNGYDSFMGIFGEWNTDQELYEAVMEFNVFFTEEEFIDWILEQQSLLLEEGYDDPVEEIRSWTDDDEISDTHIYKTEDGYVLRVNY